MRAKPPTTELRHVNWRISRDVRQALKVAAALDAIPSEQYANDVLARHLARRGLLPAANGDAPPKPAA